MSFTERQVERLRQLEQENNELKYQLKSQLNQKNKLLRELKSIKASRIFKYSMRLRSGYLRLKAFLKYPVVKYNKAKEARNRTRTASRLKKLHETLVAEAAQLPKSNGVGLEERLPLSLAIITDEYMYNYYKDAFSSVFWLTPENYREIFENNRIDLFLYVSCWRGGLKNEWRGHTRVPELMRAIDEILSICERKGIYRVFQTIEDPSNFEHFLPLATKFPCIFTSDRDIVSRYEDACPDSKVFYAEYGVNPSFNNPVGLFNNIKYDAFFAGSYPKRYEERCRDMEVMFDSIKGSGLQLVVADRNFELGLQEYKFPEKYFDSVIGSFSHSILQSVHKLFALNLNLNSIKGSSTMCAMRVYELQAQGALLISNYAKSVANHFPGVDIISSEKDFKHYLERANSFELMEKRVRSIRRIMTDKTAAIQVKKMMCKVGIEVSLETRKRLLVVSDMTCQGGLLGIDKFVDVEFVASSSLRSVNLDNFDFIAFFSLNHDYEPYYLLDMLNAFRFADVEYITRKAYFSGGEFVSGAQHEFVDSRPDPFLTLYRLRGDNKKALVEQVLTDAYHGKGYSVDCFGVNYGNFRRLRSNRLGPTDFSLSVIIPVYNNGQFLLERCFESLLTNRRFSEFEIILVDDCSADRETLDIIERLSSHYANVKVISLTDGPSGSASVPRNVGIANSSSKYLTFLDPDNSISPFGYDRLLSAVEKDPDADAVFGYQLKITKSGAVPIGKLFREQWVRVSNPRVGIVIEKGFPVVSTQAALIRRDLLLRNNIDYITGAIGQDTTFGYEVLLCAKDVVFTHDAYLEYFAERGDSVTNNIGRRFFERSLLLEVEQKRRLERYGCWSDYQKLRSSGFIRGWYAPKLDMVSDGEKQDCLELFNKIAEINAVSLNLVECGVIENEA